MDVTWRTIFSFGLLAVFAGAYEYENEPVYPIPSDCKPCDTVKCPILVYCAGIKMKDRCGCCERCSSALFQPHASPRQLPVGETKVETNVEETGIDRRFCFVFVGNAKHLVTTSMFS